MKRDLAGVRNLDQLMRPSPFQRDPSEVLLENIPGTLSDALGVPPVTGLPVVHEEAEWVKDDVAGVELHWNVGFGPDTHAWLLRPAGESAALPGVVALHCHGGMKYFGKEKIADGPSDESRVRAFREECYAGVAYANELARNGFTVMVHDAFGWGSRRMPIEQMSWRARRAAELDLQAATATKPGLGEPELYDIFARANEDSVAKLLGLLGTSWGGVVARDDIIAARITASRPETIQGGVAVVGMSGGGTRAALVNALEAESVRGSAIVAMMSTFSALLDGFLHNHTWMLMNPGMARVGEWPDIAAARAPRPLFVSYATKDANFPHKGMTEADARIRSLYSRQRAQGSYRAHWADEPHSMRNEARHAMTRWLHDIFG